MASGTGLIRASSNGRYFVEEDGTPFFWLGDTQWELFRGFPLEGAADILETRQRQGFSVLQVMLTGVGDGTKPTPAGERPWTNDDPLTPNERYSAHVDEVVRLSRGTGIVLAIGVYHQLQVERITVANARGYARWVAERYADVPNLVWSMYPKAEEEFVPVVRALAEGLREGDEGRHVITVHPDPSPASSSFLHVEPWLSFHSIQTWADTHLIVPMVSHDYGLQPPKPVVMAEGAYEGGTEYGFEVTPLWVRRQAWWTYLAGGHHSYGHNDCWRMLPTWREALNAPGAVQLGVLRQVLSERERWWDLVPDRSLITEQMANTPTLDVACRSATGDWALAYLGAGGSVAIALDWLGTERSACAAWVSPITGERTAIGSASASGTGRFPAPAGWEDALLLLEAEQ
jgi:Protein of unknown function (DUF4038)/Putative collagen-binding domain of a collagenase